ncbi:MAG: AAA family ATPase [Gammaproteobacteria bacterium]|nr:AAA family ATPase [Gammaproteobacteria bacterium]
MDNRHDLELILRSRIPIIVIQSHEEHRILHLLGTIGEKFNKPLFKWSVTEGFQFARFDIDGDTQHNEPKEVLEHIKAERQAGIYVLLDFHHYINDPVHIRLVKDIALDHSKVARYVVLLSYKLDLPPELRHFSADFELALPSEKELNSLVHEVAKEWASESKGERVKADPEATRLLIRNLAGLTHSDAKRLVRNAIYYDGAITHSDLSDVMEAKYKLLSGKQTLAFEHETSQFSQVGGLKNLKRWLEDRRQIVMGKKGNANLDMPKGILLLGVQGCGKSLAARAVAGVFAAPLLRLDMGALFNKYYGESERNIREALKIADTMAPCVLWIDEVEKGLSAEDDDGPSRRIFATMLTWMAEKDTAVFIVATANDMSLLPPEFVRKGRFDEIFFVDLPDADTRGIILKIHMSNRSLNPREFDVQKLVHASDGFSGAELEQAVVSALYRAHARDELVSTDHILTEIERTQPLSVVMAEHVDTLRAWAADRTVPAH